MVEEQFFARRRQGLVGMSRIWQGCLKEKEEKTDSVTVVKTKSVWWVELRGPIMLYCRAQ